MHCRILIGAVIGLLAAAANAQSLADLEAQSKQNPGTFDQVLERGRTTHAAVVKLIDSDSLVTGEDFRRAGMLQLGANERQQAVLSTGYQLLLTALAMGDQEAGKNIAKAWDGLLMAMGRYRRIGVLKMPFKVDKGDHWWIDPAPKPIRSVLMDPDTAKKVAFDSKDNREVQQIVDADQKVRANFSHMTSKEMKNMAQEDWNRFTRIREIIDGGGLKTAQDFWNAALVCQHGQSFLDYALAHELSICAMILGKGDASWLAGASYDRMLLSASYPQAFDTQYVGSWHMREFSSEGINDRMRTAVVHMTLAQSQDREKHPPKM